MSLKNKESWTWRGVKPSGTMNGTIAESDVGAFFAEALLGRVSEEHLVAGPECEDIQG
jgi:hypothetical protein